MSDQPYVKPQWWKCTGCGRETFASRMPELHRLHATCGFGSTMLYAVCGRWLPKDEALALEARTTGDAA